MDLITLAAAKNYASKVAAGITAARVEGSSIILTLTDGSEAVCQLPMPKDGISVIDLSIDIDGSLLCHMSDGTTIDAGYVPTVDPDLTNYYTKEEMEEKLNSKQDTLTAGNNITIDENGVVSASGGDNDFLVITTPTHLSFTSSGTISKDLTDINKADILNCLNSGSYDKPILLKTDLNSDGYQETYIFNVSTIQLQYNRFQYVLDYIYRTTDHPYNFIMLSLKPTGTYPNYTDVSATVNMYYRGNIMKTTDVLLRNNTSSYTPTSDYNPATKKYVDDSISSAITDALGGRY